MSQMKATVRVAWWRCLPPCGTWPIHMAANPDGHRDRHATFDGLARSDAATSEVETSGSCAYGERSGGIVSSAGEGAEAQKRIRERSQFALGDKSLYQNVLELIWR